MMSRCQGRGSLGFFDGSTKALVLKNVTMREGVKNCVTLWTTPKNIKKVCHYEKYFHSLTQKKYFSNIQSSEDYNNHSKRCNIFSSEHFLGATHLEKQVALVKRTFFYRQIGVKAIFKGIQLKVFVFSRVLSTLMK